MDQAQVFQMAFNIPTRGLEDLKYELRVEQELVRWVWTRHDTAALPPPKRMQMGDVMRMVREEASRESE